MVWAVLGPTMRPWLDWTAATRIRPGHGVHWQRRLSQVLLVCDLVLRGTWPSRRSARAWGRPPGTGESGFPRSWHEMDAGPAGRGGRRSG